MGAGRSVLLVESTAFLSDGEAQTGHGRRRSGCRRCGRRPHPSQSGPIGLEIRGRLCSDPAPVLRSSRDRQHPEAQAPPGRRRRPGPGAKPGRGSVGAGEYAGGVTSQADRTISDEPVLAYQTEAGEAWLGDAIETLEAHVEDESVDLIVTSPPFALQRPKEYGNESQEGYKTWFLPFADEFWRVLKPTGSLVIDLGGAWESGRAVKSLYAFELLITLCRRPNRPFVLAQDLYWYNPARLPSPAQWVTVERVRVKDSVDYLWWLAKGPNPKSDNGRVLPGIHGRDEAPDRERHIQSRTPPIRTRDPRRVHRGPRRRDPPQPARDLKHRQRPRVPGQLSASVV